jgi:hypothetical protein
MYFLLHAGFQSVEKRFSDPEILFVERSELYRLGDMLRLYRLRMRKIGNRACDTEHTVIPARGQIHLFECGFKKSERGIAHRAELAYFASRHRGVARRSRPHSANRKRARVFNSRAYLRGGFGFFLPCQLIEGKCGQLDLYVDSVEQRSAYFGEIFFDILTAAGTFSDSRAVVSASARVHRADEHEPARVCDATRRAGYRNLSILKRLAHRLGNRLIEFGQLVEEENPSRGEGYLAGHRDRTSADKRGRGHCVVR